MLFKKKICPKCESQHDEMLDYCPYCKEKNEGITEFRKKSKITFLPFYDQLILFAVGFIGFLLMNILFSLIFDKVYIADNIKGLMLIDSLSYVSVFTGLIILIFPFKKGILDRFKSYWPYLIALLGCVALIGGNIILNLIIDSIHPTHTGGNQSAAEQLIHAYPVIAIIVLGIIGPICEEIGYRLGLFSFLRRVHPALAYIGASLIFAFIHFDFSNPDLINELLLSITYFWAGLCFSLTYDVGGIGASIIAHIVNNLFSIILIMNGI